MKIPYIKHNHSICLLAYHFVTVTKRRKPELEGIELDLFKLAVEKYPITIHVGEIMPDHIYLLIQAPSTFSPSYIAKLIKGCSSRAIGKVVVKAGMVGVQDILSALLEELLSKL